MLTVDLAGVERQGLLAATAHFHLGIVSVNTIPKLVAESINIRVGSRVGLNDVSAEKN